MRKGEYEFCAPTKCQGPNKKDVRFSVLSNSPNGSTCKWHQEVGLAASENARRNNQTKRGAQSTSARKWHLFSANLHMASTLSEIQPKKSQLFSAVQR